jgi:acyl-CoA thioesterase
VHRRRTGSGNGAHGSTRLASQFQRKLSRGAIFALADTAFGLASNSHGILAAGIDAHIAFPAPASTGEVLTATALEVSRSRRLAIYRVEVHAGNGTLVAVFTGTVYITGKSNAAT